MNSLVSFQMRTLGVHFGTAWMVTKVDSAFLQIWIVPSIVPDFDCGKFTATSVRNRRNILIVLFFVIKAAFVSLFWRTAPGNSMLTWTGNSWMTGSYDITARIRRGWGQSQWGRVWTCWEGSVIIWVWGSRWRRGVAFWIAPRRGIALGGGIVIEFKFKHLNHFWVACWGCCTRMLLMTIVETLSCVRALTVKAVLCIL